MCGENLIIFKGLITAKQYELIQKISSTRNATIYDAVSRRDLKIYDIHELIEQFTELLAGGIS